MSPKDAKPKAGDNVVPAGLPSRFLDDLPIEDQRALSAMVGKQLL
jgi:hypothetical protein